MTSGSRNGGLVAAMAGAHAPQLFSPPEEDVPAVERVRSSLAELRRRLVSEHGVETLILVSGDHVTNFFSVVPQFAVYVGDQIEGEFRGRNHRFASDYELAQELVEGCLLGHFDVAVCYEAALDSAQVVALDYLAADGGMRILPLFVNQYMPPQPTPQRCFAWGQELRRLINMCDRAVAAFGSGGMSHYPGTRQYAHPDNEWDAQFMSWISGGNWDHIERLSVDELDAHGNLELLQWFVVMGMVGTSQPADVLVYEPGKNHGYSVVDWRM